MQVRNLNAASYGTNFLPSSIDSTVSGNRPLPANFLRPIQGFADIQYLEFSSNSNYNALQARMYKRFSSSLTFNLSYTWSKVLDVADTPSSAVNPVLDYRSRNYGPAGFDRRQALSLSYVYVLPPFSQYWNNSLSRQALDGWEITGISAFISGAPTPVGYTFVTAADVTGTTGAGLDSRVNLTCNPNISRATGRSAVHSKRPALRLPPRRAWESEMHRNSPRGPGRRELRHLAVQKLQTRRIEFPPLAIPLETYNTFNHTQFTAMNASARFDADGNQVNRQFGQYTASAAARRLVLGLKFYF